MKTMTRLLSLLAAVTSLSLLGSCGGNSQESEPTRKGEYCDATGAAFCERATTCQVVPDESSCVQEFRASCCEQDETCELLAKDAEQLRALQHECVPALSAQACEDLAAGVLPSACRAAPADR